MDVFEAIAKRHSYRGPYEDRPVPRDDLRRIVQAGLQAPSGKNMQTTRFVIVDEPELVRQIKAKFTERIEEASTSKESSPLTEEMEEALRALGYIE